MTEVFADNLWAEVPLSERLRLQKPDGQARINWRRRSGPVFLAQLSSRRRLASGI